jgi:NAD+ synthase (glutamine-hydrolysing)
VKAVGSEHVLGVTMPSQYSSEGSVSDSKKLAENLGIQCKTIPIQTIVNTYCTSLQTHFENSKPDVTEENIQARIRGTLLMALSNKFTMLVLSTGNKSEMAVGYCTLYGDMCGGLAVIADLYKTTVYELARFINKEKEVIPQAIIDKEPSAELKPNQRDSDTLPPYEVLDKILTGIIEQNLSSQEIIAQGFDAQSVQWVTQAIAKNEYKRRQAAPGLKTTLKAFGCGRRFPVAAKYSR